MVSVSDHLYAFYVEKICCSLNDKCDIQKYCMVIYTYNVLYAIF